MEKGESMKKWWILGTAILASFPFCMAELWAQDTGKAQKRILMERGEKATGARLDLVRRVIEGYKDCKVLASGNELKGLQINGKMYQDFTLVIREAKRTIIVVTADGVVAFDY